MGGVHAESRSDKKGAFPVRLLQAQTNGLRIHKRFLLNLPSSSCMARTKTAGTGPFRFAFLPGFLHKKSADGTPASTFFVERILSFDGTQQHANRLLQDLDFVLPELLHFVIRQAQVVIAVG